MRPTKRLVPPHQRLLEARKNPLVQRAGELFGAEPLRVEERTNNRRPNRPAD